MPNIEPVHPEVLHVLLIHLIRAQGGSVTASVLDLLVEVTAGRDGLAHWAITATQGPGPGEGTWSVALVDQAAPGQD